MSSSSDISESDSDEMEGHDNQRLKQEKLVSPSLDLDELQTDASNARISPRPPTILLPEDNEEGTGSVSPPPSWRSEVDSSDAVESLSLSASSEESSSSEEGIESHATAPSSSDPKRWRSTSWTARPTVTLSRSSDTISRPTDFFHDHPHSLRVEKGMGEDAMLRPRRGSVTVATQSRINRSGSFGRDVGASVPSKDVKKTDKADVEDQFETIKL